MEIATSPTREKYPLSPKKIVKKTITSTIGWSFLLIFLLFMVFGIGAGIMSDSNQDPTAFVGLLVFILFGFVFLLIVIALLSYLYQRWYFAVYFYDRRGV